MVKKTKGSHRLDKFYHLAKEQGFRSRAAFKLIQLNRQFDFLSKCNRILDLGAAPGGWLQVASKFMPLDSTVLGVDIMPIKPIRGVQTFIEDITTAKCRATVKKAANGKLMDVILHDGAPNVGGVFSKEMYNQALRICTDLLAPKGTFVTKVFRSGDYSSLLFAFNQLFERVDATKPVASRNESTEIFVVCRGYKAPKKVDARLLDHRTLFQKDDEPMPNPDVFSNSKQKRNRTGYESGLSLIYKVKSAAEFILAEKPTEMLSQFSKLSLVGEDALVQPSAKPTEGDGEGSDGEDDEEDAELGPSVNLNEHPATTQEIRALVEDLRVLGKKEFKLLMKWRNDVKKTLITLAKEAGKGGDAEGAAGKVSDGNEADDEEDEEAKLLRQMEELNAKMARQKRSKKKAAQKLKAKQRKKVALGGMKGDAADVSDPHLFGLANVRGDKEMLAGLSDAAAPGLIAASIAEREGDGDSSDDGGEQRDEWDLESDATDSDADSDAEREKHVRRMEKYIDKLYDHYDKQVSEVGRSRRKRVRVGDKNKDAVLGGALDKPGASDSDPDSEAEAAAASIRKKTREANPLLVDLEEKKELSGSALASQWFSQPVFGGIDMDALEEEEEEEATVGGKGKRPEAVTAADRGGVAEASAMEVSDEEEEEEDESEDEGAAQRMVPKTPPKSAAKGKAAVSSSANGVLAPPAAAASTPGGMKGLAKGKKEGKRGGITAAAALADDDWTDSVTPKRKRQAEQEFEEVAQHDDRDGGGSESDSDVSVESDEDILAEDLALAKRMLRGRSKHDIIDASYNRYNFHDEGLPEWFEADERKHMRAPKQVSKEEVAEERARLADIDARPIKKVVEAKARKKQRISRAMERAKSAAGKVAEQEDMSAGARMREIQRIYAKAQTAVGKTKGGKANGKKPDRVRGKRDRNSSNKAKGPALDRRLMADKRGQKAADKRNSKRKGKGGGGKGGKGGGGKGKAGGGARGKK